MAEARILYIATAEGLVQLANPGKSDRWREIGRALTEQDLRAVVASPNDPLLALAASSAGISRSANGGMSWDLVLAEPIRSLVFDAAATLYASAERGTLLRSADGSDWVAVARLPAPILGWSLLEDGTLIGVSVDGRLYQQIGAEWQARDAQVLEPLAITADPSDPEALLIVGTRSLYTPQGEQPLPAAATGALLMLRGQQPVLLLATHEALLRSDDRGATGAPVEGPTGVTVLVTPPRFIDQVFAGTAQGALWFSADRGRTWAELRAGYPAIHGVAFARAL
ncbi:MAG TPA: hypothetical protein VFZ66_00545 [Herpetosiphonaceae bacterium]